MELHSTDRADLSGVDPVVSERVLTGEALAFVQELHERFGDRRLELLAARGGRPPAHDHLRETRAIRDGDWSVAPPPPDYIDRRVEITGPTDRKLIINALNSGAQGFMADFEDANSPTWKNQIEGQANLMDAVDRTISYDSSDGRQYQLNEQTSRLLVRPRGWHLPEKHLSFHDRRASGSLVDFGLYFFHGGRRLAQRGNGIYLYLPKLEHHLEARLWNDIFCFAEDSHGLSRGTIRATVLIETLPAAFQMDEILYELREHSLGLNAGRWDYMFSTIKTFRLDPAFVLPDRNSVTMTAPFMRAYTELLVKTCHARGAFAMGGMSAVIPSRTDAEANQRALAAVRADKHREANDGFDGTWVAHPDVVAAAMGEFSEVLGGRPNQISRRRDEVATTPAQLLDVAATPGEITTEGVRSNIDVAFRYISFWLTGRGAAAINNMMEDAATAEIARTQLWQWIRTGRVAREQVVELLDETTARIHADVGDATWERGRPAETRTVFERTVFAEELEEFLTLVGYEFLD